MNSTSTQHANRDTKAIGCNCNDCRCVECRCRSNDACNCPSDKQEK
jgi:hypothetical protein